MCYRFALFRLYRSKALLYIIMSVFLSEFSLAFQPCFHLSDLSASFSDRDARSRRRSEQWNLGIFICTSDMVLWWSLNSFEFFPYVTLVEVWPTLPFLSRWSGEALKSKSLNRVLGKVCSTPRFSNAFKTRPWNFSPLNLNRLDSSRTPILSCQSARNVFSAQRFILS
ncbi:hypothetical protein VTO42DRAFT_2787 [Malbranchea cinnamomea]